MKTLVFGSCNLDFIYKTDERLPFGEIPAMVPAQISSGGKGVNQSIALKKAGMDTYFAGRRGADGDLLRQVLEENGVNTSFLRTSPGISGQAHILVNGAGENYILKLCPGANYEITRADIDGVLAAFGPGDLLVLQNEISELPYLIDAGFRRGMRTVLNPSPFTPAMREIDYAKIWLVFVNEEEAAGLAEGRAPGAFVADMRKKYPETCWVVTLGKEGSLYFDASSLYRQAALPANVADTTCAGDTFTGFFTAALCAGADIPSALLRGAAASSITISRVGAAGVIPAKAEVDALVSAR